MEQRIIPKLAFSVLEDAKQYYETHKHINTVIWQQLLVFFGDTLIEALELLENRNCKLIKYQTQDQLREIYKIYIKKIESFTIYQNINFCQCQQFKEEILKIPKHVLCKHLLLLKLNEIVGVQPIKIETITESQFVEFLNEQINHI